jgi:hypothetical protein
MAKVTVTDPTGENWTVRRWWFTAIPWQSGFQTLDMLIFLIVLPFMAVWPFWLALKWLGVRWEVRVEHDGSVVAKEKVRGWRRSGERIAQIAAEIQSGTAQYSIDPA